MKYVLPVAVLAALTAAVLLDKITGTQFVGALVGTGALAASPSIFPKKD